MHVALFDAMGHGLVAATLAATAAAGYRHGRRAGHELPGLAAELDEMIDSQTGGERFVTAWLGRLHVPTGRLHYVNAGHPPALLLRDGRVVKELEAAPDLPLGLGTRVGEVGVEDLEPGDRVLAYTDGVVEARSTDHGFFGEARLVDFLEKEAASGHAGPEILRRLTLAVVEHQEGQLQDDSSMVLLEWRGGAE
jgi:serine phosphatase RsbU (regulator of sigma subunit)